MAFCKGKRDAMLMERPWPCSETCCIRAQGSDVVLHRSRSPTAKFHGRMGRRRRAPPGRPRDGASHRCRRWELVGRWSTSYEVHCFGGACKRRKVQVIHIECNMKGGWFFWTSFSGVGKYTYDDLDAGQGLLAGSTVLRGAWTTRTYVWTACKEDESAGIC